MSGPFLILVVLGVAAVVLAVSWAVAFAQRRTRSITVDAQEFPGLSQLQRATMRARRLALIVGLVVSLILLIGGFADGFEFTGPAVAALLCVAVIWSGQQSHYRAARADGVAGLDRRSLRDYVPRNLVGWVAATLGVLVVAASVTTAVASPDDRGRRRALSWACEGAITHGDGTVERVTGNGGGSPFPGAFYTIPLAVVLLVLLAVAWAALASVVRRPRNGSDPALVSVDDALRRITAEGIVASVGVGLAGSLVLLAGVAFPKLGQAVSACGLNGMDAVNGGAYIAGSYGLFATCLFALVVGLRSFVVLAIPGNGQPR